MPRKLGSRLRTRTFRASLGRVISFEGFVEAGRGADGPAEEGEMGEGQGLPALPSPRAQQPTQSLGMFFFTVLLVSVTVPPLL
jgi:hypothetical protein